MYVGGWGLTDGCLTELLLSHLVGNVGPHQHAHGDAKVLPNHFRDELQPLGALVYPLGTGWSSGQVPFTPAEGFPQKSCPFQIQCSSSVPPQRSSPSPAQPELAVRRADSL